MVLCSAYSLNKVSNQCSLGPFMGISEHTSTILSRSREEKDIVLPLTMRRIINSSLRDAIADISPMSIRGTMSTVLQDRFG